MSSFENITENLSANSKRLQMAYDNLTSFVEAVKARMPVTRSEKMQTTAFFYECRARCLELMAERDAILETLNQRVSREREELQRQMEELEIF